MQVTLKKAAELSRAILAAAKATEPKKIITVSAFSTEDVETIVGDGVKAFNVDMTRLLSNIEVGYAIRSAIGHANAAAGVDALLAEVAAMDEKIVRLSAISGESDDFAVVGTADMTAAKRQVEQARKDALDGENRRYGIHTNIKLSVFADMSVIDNKIAAIKRQRSTLKDTLTGINFNSKITLEETWLDVLRSEKLID